MGTVNNVSVSNLFVMLSLSVVSLWGSPNGNTRIADGDDAKTGQFPYQISLHSRERGRFIHLCGGAIISQEFVITAGQCVHKKMSEEYRIFVGGLSQDDGEEYEIKQIFIHEQIDYDYYINDIALIQLKHCIKFSSTVAPISLGHEFIGGGLQAITSGYGDIEDSSQNLKYVILDTLTNDECRKIFSDNPDAITDKILCANDGISGVRGRGPCPGDTGGALVYNNTIVGITSTGEVFCYSGKEFAYGFTRISKYHGWIEKIVSAVV